MPSALITGVTGFVGRFLASSLREKGYRVAGIDQWPTTDMEGIDYYPASILDQETLTRVITKARPSEVYHLAAISFLPDADATPRLSMETNIIGTVAMCDVVKNSCPSARLLIVSSSKVYGSQVESPAIDEDEPAQPTDFYGISKYAAEIIGLQYHRQFGLDVRVTRSFNHTGPGQSPRFVCADWARQVAAIDAGRQEPVMKVGNLQAHIDFSDVRDVVEAYRLILARGRPGGVYNVCSGHAVSLEKILSILTGYTGKTIEVTSVSRKIRSHKTSPRMAGDNSLLRTETGWKPSIPLTQTLADVYAYWRRQVLAPDQ